MSVSKNKNFCKEKKSYCRGRFRPKPKKLNVNDEQFPTFEVVNILRSNIRDFKELCRIGSSVFKAPFPAFQAMRLKTHLDYSCESATTFIGWFACCKKLRKVSIYATHCPTVFYSSSLRLVWIVLSHNLLIGESNQKEGHHENVRLVSQSVPSRKNNCLSVAKRSSLITQQILAYLST